MTLCYSVMCGIDFSVLGLIAKNKIQRKMNALLCMLMLFMLPISLVYHAPYFGFNRFKSSMENFLKRFCVFLHYSGKL